MKIYNELWKIYYRSFFRHLLKFAYKNSKIKIIISIFLFSILTSLIILLFFLDKYQSNIFNHLSLYFILSLFVLAIFIIDLCIFEDALNDAFQKKGYSLDNFYFIKRANRLRERFILFLIQVKEKSISVENVENLLKSDFYKIELSYEKEESNIVSIIKSNPISSLLFLILLTILGGLSSQKEYIKFFQFLAIFIFLILILSTLFTLYIRSIYIPKSEKVKEFNRFLHWYVNLPSKYKEGRNNE